MNLACCLPAVLFCSLVFAQTPGSEELNRLVNGKEYSVALQKIAAALQLRGSAAKAVHRHEVYMLKGECHLQLKQVTMAIEAYQQAAKEATSAAERSAAQANELLVRQSRAFAYPPRAKDTNGKPKPPIDILDGESRKSAFGALLADEMTANDAKIKAARNAKALPPLMEGVKTVVTMEGLEQAATGKTDKSNALLAELTEHSKKLVSDALKTMSKRLGEIDKEANTYIEFYQDVYDPRAKVPGVMKREKAYKKKGLTDLQFKELREINVTCDKLPEATQTLAAGLKQEAKAFEPMVNEAGRIRNEVDRLLDTDYQRTYKGIPK